MIKEPQPKNSRGNFRFPRGHRFPNLQGRCVFILVSWLVLLFVSAGWSATFSNSYDPFHDRLGHDKLGQVGSKSIFYLNDQYQNPDVRSVQLFEGRITREADESDFSLGIDLEGQFSHAQQGFNSFTANEFYFRMDPLWSGTTLFLGRKRSHWSSLDDRWKLGLWQPNYRIDALNPHSQGLTGLFVDFKKDNWTLEFFGTPFFLPDHGPQMETRNGMFIKGHPWVQYPPSEVVIKGIATPAYYRVDKPSIPDVIVNTGYGFNFQVGDPESEGWMGRASWGYKPMNQLLLGFDGNLNLGSLEGLDVTIHPEVGFHKVASLDGVYRSEKWAMYFGILEETPDRTEFDLPWTFQNFDPAHFAGGGIEFFTGAFRIGLGAVHREGGRGIVSGPRSEAAGTVLPERFQFRDLVKTEISYGKNLGSRWSYEISGEWKQELGEGSEIISGQGALWMGPFWKAYLGMDMLRTDNKIVSTMDFIEMYQANDRVYGGLQYVF
ncbi:MAG: hypothetical protein RJB66_90 [Pseudomonadota bacterium]